ncbi:MAG: guanine deaminase [Cellvibrionaceae bacterium]|nr:guanine deaminase [Cellvibrionaceae bacterium]
MNNDTYIITGRVLHFIDEPDIAAENSYEYYKIGALVIEDGKIAYCGEAVEAIGRFPNYPIVDRHEKLIIPGMIDTHMHYPQTEITGAYGEQLLEWLETYTFPTERKFSDKAYESDVSERFISECLKNGTTTAMVFGTVHPESVDAFFEVSESYNMRNICGKVLMDRNAPDYLLDADLDTAKRQTEELIHRWHNKGRQLYAVTPRFTPTCTPEMMTIAKELMDTAPGLYLHSHLSENKGECAWVAELEPEAADYLDAYDRYGLVGPRSVFAHGIHLSEREYKRLAETGAAIAHSPTSNLFLGSGLWNKKACQDYGVRAGLASDVGAGTSFSQLQTLNEAYKIQQLQGQKLSAFQSFYFATLGSAKSIYLDDKIGNFEVGKEADFVIMDNAGTELMKYRQSHSHTLEEELFVLGTIGDDRSIAETYVMGVRVYDKERGAQRPAVELKAVV